MKRCSNQYCITFLDAQLANTALRKSDTRFKRSSALLQSGSDITFCNSFCSGVCWFCICCGGGGGGFRKSVLNIIGDGDDNHRSPNKSQFPPQPPPLLPAARAQRLVIRAAAALSKLLRAIAITRKVQKAKQHTIIPRQIRPAHVRTRPRDEYLRGSVCGGNGVNAHGAAAMLRTLRSSCGSCMMRSSSVISAEEHLNACCKMITKFCVGRFGGDGIKLGDLMSECKEQRPDFSVEVGCSMQQRVAAALRRFRPGGSHEISGGHGGHGTRSEDSK